MALRDRARERLAALEEAGLLRRLVELEGPTGPRAQLGGRELIGLASNDYLGLANHPELIDAVREGAARWGAGAGASRLVTGHMGAHRWAEESLAGWLGRPMLLFGSGYAANVGVVQTLVEEGDLVVSDALNHASIIDGCRLSRARVVVFRHRDLAHAAELLETHRSSARHVLVVSDAVFSMDGDQADLPGLRALADRFDATLMVDEAHAIGVFGPEGRGASVAAGIQPDVLVGTLGKALGLSGAFVCADREVIDLLTNRARSFVFSTAIAPAVAAAVPVAVGLTRRADAARAHVESLARRLRTGLRAGGWAVGADVGPIVPVVVGDGGRVLQIAGSLEERGVLVRPIRPPTVPVGTARLRLTVSAAHPMADVERAVGAFEAIR